jgi:heme-degrading monooxygenase HmoA
MSTIIPKGSIIASFVYEKSNNLKGYKEMDDMTIKEVIKNEGYLGHEVFSKNEKYIFISYWKDIKSIQKWKNNKLHIEAKKMGNIWYKSYKIQISELQNNYNLD